MMQRQVVRNRQNRPSLEPAEQRGWKRVLLENQRQRSVQALMFVRMPTAQIRSQALVLSWIRMLAWLSRLIRILEPEV